MTTGSSWHKCELEYFFTAQYVTGVIYFTFTMANPNQGGSIVYLNYVSGSINVIVDGQSYVIVTQFGNMINLQLKGTLPVAQGGDYDEMTFETVLTSADPLIARMNPGASPVVVPFLCKGSDLSQSTTVIVSFVNNRVRFTMKPPVDEWDAVGDYTLNGCVISYAAEAQSSLDFWYD